MREHNLFTINRRWSIHVCTALFLLTGLFSFRAELLGKTVTTTQEDAEAPESPTLTAPAILPDSLIEVALRHPRSVAPLPPVYIDTETLWLARVIYSESKRLEEQELVAWVVRNRVETAYRGQSTYEDVALDPYQFSAFNPNNRKLRYYINLDVASKAPGWHRTLALAYYVRHANPALRPFSTKTRHFYSERAMVGRTSPEWTEGLEPITPQRALELDAQRFRFYAGVM